MGKSGSGKDTIFKELMKRAALIPVITYTTRPMRANECDGDDYFFISPQKLSELKAAEKVIECRSYNTVQGVWFYATVDDGQIDLGAGNYLLITTLEAYQKIFSYFGKDYVVPIYIDVPDGLRLSRVLSRENEQEHPDYAELCRRFLADCKDFSEEKLKYAGILECYSNVEFGECINNILDKMSLKSL